MPREHHSCILWQIDDYYGESGWAFANVGGYSWSYNRGELIVNNMERKIHLTLNIIAGPNGEDAIERYEYQSSGEIISNIEGYTRAFPELPHPRAKFSLHSFCERTVAFGGTSNGTDLLSSAIVFTEPTW